MNLTIFLPNYCYKISGSYLERMFTNDRTQESDADIVTVVTCNVFDADQSEYAPNLINFSKYDCNDSDNSVIITIFAVSFYKKKYEDNR